MSANGLTLSDGIDLIAPILGLCPDRNREKIRRKLMEVIHRVILEGGGETLRKWCVCVSGGCFTAPRDLETPLKFKLEEKVANVWSKMYEFYHGNDYRCDDYSVGMIEEPNPVYTYHDVPNCPVHIAAVSDGEECPESRIIVQGLNQRGEEIFVQHKGLQFSGEWLSLTNENATLSTQLFTKITGVEKSKTVNHVRLYWVNVASDGNVTKQGLLSVYRPDEKIPRYRRYRLEGVDCHCIYKATILGRICSPNYFHDNDILPAVNTTSLIRMTEAMVAEQRNETERARYNLGIATRYINKENDYKATGQESLDYKRTTSPGGVRNIS